MLETVSAAPSTRPMYAGAARSTSVRKTGRSGKIISVPTSVKRLVKPSRMTESGRLGVLRPRSSAVIVFEL